MSRKTSWRSVRSWMESLLDTPQFPLAQEPIHICIDISFPAKYCPTSSMVISKHGNFQQEIMPTQVQQDVAEVV